MEIHGGGYACELRGKAVNSAVAEHLEQQVGLARQLVRL